MSDERIGQYRRRTLQEHADKMGWPGDGRAELATFLGRERASQISPDLSAGFSRKAFPLLERFFKQRLPEDLWVKGYDFSNSRVEVVESRVSAPDQLFHYVDHFLCIRAPNVDFRRPQKTHGSLDDQGLVTAQSLGDNDPPRDFVKRIWHGVRQGRIHGELISATGRIGAIAEVWAAAECLNHSNHKGNVSIHLLSVEHTLHKVGHVQSPYFPMIGVRVVNKRKCLISIPTSSNSSDFGNIINDTKLAAMFGVLAKNLQNISYDLTNVVSEQDIKDILEHEYNVLIRAQVSCNTQYGKIRSFADVIEVKNRIVGLALNDRFLPPLA